MKRKESLRQMIVVSLVAAVAIIMITGCVPAAPVTPPPVTPPPVAPPPVAPPVAPPEKVVTAKIGFLGPLTGPVAGWGLPAEYGDEIWADKINAAGGILLPDGTRVLVEIVPYDSEYTPDKALAGAKKLVLEDNVVMVQMLGGDDAAAAVPWLTEQKMVSTTFLALDATPETPYHIAPMETGPVCYQTDIVWAIENHPEARTMAMATQPDDYGKACFAIGYAAAELYGLDVVYDKYIDYDTVDFAPTVSAMLATNPDIIRLTGAWPDFITLICEQLYLQGFDGILVTGVLDFYSAIIDRTSPEFMEGTIWFFPDYDDPMLSAEDHDFWDEYQSRYPGCWSAVSHEGMEICRLWKYGVEKAGSIDPMAVYAALRAEPTLPHAFGPAVWWGKEIFGVDNALIGSWPVVTMHNGKSKIVEMVDNLSWWQDKTNAETVIKYLEGQDMMWYQRMGLTKEEAMAKYPEAFE